jgi:hypothetical protein
MSEPLSVGVGPTLCPPSNAVLFDEARNLVVGRETRAVRFCALAFPRDVALVAGLYRATRDGGFRPDPTGDARGAMRLPNIAQRAIGSEHEAGAPE